MSEDPVRPPGKTTIAPDVLATIARLTALQIDGVSRLEPQSTSVRSFLRRKQHDGVRVEVTDDRVYLDLHVVLSSGVNIREISQEIQEKVTRAVSQMVGMDVGKVNIHVDDIDYSIS